ncbi:MAG: hypothetical protein HYY93_05755 [Planctomycetes bacterium]|nr:hypothetical protein [Planctomycetota bacterium]
MSKKLNIVLTLALVASVITLAGCGGGGGGNGGTTSPSGFNFGSQSETGDFSASVAGELSATGPYNMAADGAALTESTLDVTDPDVFFDEDGNAIITFSARTETAPLNGFDGAHSTTAAGNTTDTYSILLSYYRASDNRLTKPQAISGGDSEAMPTRPIVMFNGEASSTNKRGDAVIVYSRDTNSAVATATEQDLLYTVFDASAVTASVNGFGATATNLTSVSAGNNVQNYNFVSDGNVGLTTSRRTGTLTSETQPIEIERNNVSETDETVFKSASSSLLGVVWLQDIAAAETIDGGVDANDADDDTNGTDDDAVTSLRGAIFTWSGTTSVGSFGSATDIYAVNTITADGNGTGWRTAGSESYDISPGAGSTVTDLDDTDWILACYNTTCFVPAVDDDDTTIGSDVFDAVWLTTTLTSTGFSTLTEISHTDAVADNTEDAVTAHVSTDAITSDLTLTLTPIVLGTDECSSATGVYMIFAGSRNSSDGDTDTRLFTAAVNSSTGAVALTATTTSQTDSLTAAFDDVTAILDGYVGRSGKFGAVMFTQNNGTNAGDLPYLNELNLAVTLGSSPLQGVVQLWADAEAGLDVDEAGVDTVVVSGEFQRDVQSDDKKLSLAIIIRDEDLDNDNDSHDLASEKNRLIFNQYSPKTPGGAGTDITALAVSSAGATSDAIDAFDGAVPTFGNSACTGPLDVLDGGTSSSATSAIIYYVQRDTSGAAGADATTNTADDIAADGILKAAKFNGTSIESTQVTLSTASTGLHTELLDVNVPEVHEAPSSESRTTLTKHIVIFTEERAVSTHLYTSTINTAIRSRVYTLSATWGTSAFSTPTTWLTNITPSTATNHNDVDGGGNVQVIWHSEQDTSNNMLLFWIEGNRLMYSLCSGASSWSQPNEVGNPNAGVINPTAAGAFSFAYAPSNVSTLFLDSSATAADGRHLIFAVQQYGNDGGGSAFKRCFAKVIK